MENMSILKTLAWELDKNFRPPFVEKGLVDVRLSNDENVYIFE